MKTLIHIEKQNTKRGWFRWFDSVSFDGQKEIEKTVNEWRKIGFSIEIRNFNDIIAKKGDLIYTAKLMIYNNIYSC